MKYQQGFTLLEVIMVIAALSILTIIWIYTTDPIRTINKVADVRIQSDVADLEKGLQEYLFVNESYPVTISTSAEQICNTGSDTITRSAIDCDGFVDLRPLVPSIMTEIPRHPDVAETSGGSGYAIQRNSTTNMVEVVVWEE